MIAGKIKGLGLLPTANLKGRNVILRLDLNLPKIKGKVYDTTRLDLAMPTIKLLSENGARIIVLSHFGRPEGIADPAFSLKPVFDFIQKKLAKTIRNNVVFSNIESCPPIKNGAVCVCENIRFHKGEEANDQEFAKSIAEKGDLYVNEAFSASHSAHASIASLPKMLPSYAGFNLVREISTLEKLLIAPKKPLIMAVGGNKLDTKIKSIQNLIGRVNTILVGGVIGNTFLKAKGLGVGQSNYEPNQIETAKNLLQACKEHSCKILLPKDAIVSGELSNRVTRIESVNKDEGIFDIGPETLFQFCNAAEGTLLWNGPFGKIENSAFAQGTLRFAQAIAEKTTQGKLISIAGGGDTISALNQVGSFSQITHVSSGGGAFLAWLSGVALPGIEPLMQKND